MGQVAYATWPVVLRDDSRFGMMACMIKSRSANQLTRRECLGIVGAGMALCFAPFHRAAATAPIARNAYYGQSVVAMPHGTRGALGAAHIAQIEVLLEVTQWGASLKRETVPLMAPGALMTTLYFSEMRRLEIITTTSTHLKPGIRLRHVEGLIEADPWGKHFRTSQPSR